MIKIHVLADDEILVEDTEYEGLSGVGFTVDEAIQDLIINIDKHNEDNLPF